MRESGYYPPGAEFDHNAPYNQADPEPRKFDKEFAITLYQTVTVEDDRWYKDYHGHIEDENCDFVEDYKEQMTSPKALLEEYAEILKAQVEELKAKKPTGWKGKVESLNAKIECCECYDEIIELA